MSNDASSIFNYLRQCYEIDSKSISLSNIFSTKVDNRLVVSGKDELLNGALPHLPVKESYAEKVIESLLLYEKEKSFYAFAHTVIGYIGGKRVCAPLFFIPAEIVAYQEYYYVKIQHSERFLNANFLNQIWTEGTTSLDELFEKVLTSEFLDFGEAGAIHSIFETAFNDVHSENLLLFPELTSEAKLKSTRPKSGFKVLPSLAFGTVKFSMTTIGVRTELEQLVKEEPSQALKSLLYDEMNNERKDEIGHCPSVLSEQQERARRNASFYGKSLIVGPPGTGKSFTIANIALDLMQRGKSVLIVSKTDAAVDVVFEKIKAFGFEEVVFRGGRKDYLPLIKNRLQYLLRGGSKRKKPELSKHPRYAAEVEKFARSLSKLTAEFNGTIRKELDWGNKLQELNDTEGLFARIQKRYIKWKQSLRTPMWQVAKTFYEQQQNYRKSVELDIKDRYERRLNEVLNGDREHIADFLHAIRATSLTDQTKRFKRVNMNIVLRAIPIWLANLSDLYRILPFKKDLFDVVLIDEASQCDSATALPALQRAKRMVVVGDPNQLRHFSFVSRSQMSRLKDQLGVHEAYHHLLDYKNASILDIVSKQCKSNDQVTFLDEHFRGNDHLLSFSNDHFYNGDLKTMKSLPMHQYRSVDFVETQGNRTKNGENAEELESVIRWVKNIVAQEINAPVKSSIGILSPFRKQVDAILSMIEQHFDFQAIVAHHIMVATPYGFQGNERDVMLLSWVVDNDTNAAAHNYLNNQEVFNVAVTRARYRAVNFTSFNPTALRSDSLLRRYTEHMLGFSYERFGGDRKDAFQEEVVRFLERFNLSCVMDGFVASIPVDILVHGRNGYKVIDLIGYPGHFFASIQLNEYLLLKRAGAEVFPITYANWVFDKISVEKELENFLND